MTSYLAQANGHSPIVAQLVGDLSERQLSMRVGGLSYLPGPVGKPPPEGALVDRIASIVRLLLAAPAEEQLRYLFAPLTGEGQPCKSARQAAVTVANFGLVEEDSGHWVTTALGEQWLSGGEDALSLWMFCHRTHRFVGEMLEVLSVHGRMHSTQLYEHARAFQIESVGATTKRAYLARDAGLVRLAKRSTWIVTDKGEQLLPYLPREEPREPVGGEDGDPPVRTPARAPKPSSRRIASPIPSFAPQAPMPPSPPPPTRLPPANQARPKPERVHWKGRGGFAESWHTQIGETKLYFGDVSVGLRDFIANSRMIVGCVAWVTAPEVINALRACDQGVAIVVHKEERLRTPGPAWEVRLLRDYEELPRTPGHQAFQAPLSDCNVPPGALSPIRCSGEAKGDSSTARMHHKFLVRCELIERSAVPQAVWTGSANMTRAATGSVENALAISDPAIASEYLHEFCRVAALSEPLDWAKDAVDPEWAPRP